MQGTGPKVGTSTGRQRESLVNVASKTAAREGPLFRVSANADTAQSQQSWTPRTLYGMQQMLMGQKWGKSDPRDALGRKVPEQDRREEPRSRWGDDFGRQRSPQLDREALQRMLALLSSGAIGGALATQLPNLRVPSLNAVPGIFPPSSVWMPEHMRGASRGVQA